ncbi:MAG: hypothetical protein A2743_04635 [Candidatus Taylorbacteria bacterium RIFCSPHIGHO2_01_FULL_43_47]|nr:MAG: hypothetical protein A2743_04635 [Candidatus Taylorbacteria bacterium RIFCSPHIGHO2_01_FULL_43_47]
MNATENSADFLCDLPRHFKDKLILEEWLLFRRVLQNDERAIHMLQNSIEWSCHKQEFAIEINGADTLSVYARPLKHRQ